MVELSSSSPFKGNFIGVFGVDSVCKKATKACAKDMSKPVASWISVDDVRLKIFQEKFREIKNISEKIIYNFFFRETNL